MIKSILGVLIASYALQTCPCSADLPYPYNTIELLPFDGQSLYSNADAMKALITKRNVKTVVEVGSWLGASTRHIAQTLPIDGKVYAVDHWLGGSDQHPLDYLNVKLPTLYEQFLSNVVHAGLTDKIIPIRMDSVSASKALNVFPDLVYIDGSHEEQDVYNDIVAWYPFIQGHGVICGDDWGWGGDRPIQKAVKRFATENGLSICENGWFWYLQDPSLESNNPRETRQR